MMLQLLLLLSIVQSSDNPTIYIALDKSDKSKLLKRELTTNCFDRINTKLKPLCKKEKLFIQKYEDIRRNIHKKWDIVFIEPLDIEHPILQTYPQYKTSKYDKYRRFPIKTFGNFMRPLLSIKAIGEFYFEYDEKVMVKWKALRKYNMNKHLMNVGESAQEFRQFVKDEYNVDKFDMWGRVFGNDGSLKEINKQIRKDWLNKFKPEWKPPKKPLKPIWPWNDKYNSIPEKYLQD